MTENLKKRIMKRSNYALRIMKKIVSALFKGMVLVALAAGVFLLSFVYESNFSGSSASQQANQLILHTSASKIEVVKDGQGLTLGDGSMVSQGDEVSSGNFSDVVLNFGQDGQLRLDEQTKVKINLLDNEKSQFVFNVETGRVWLQNSYSNADVNLLFSGGVVLPGQSVVMVKVGSGKADVYVNQHDAVLAVVDTDYLGDKIINEDAADVVNKLYLPHGTVATIFADKIKENKSTIARLLFSKLVKELGYSVFDKTSLSDDVWLSNNLLQDKILTSKIRDDRLKSIRGRGLKYSSLEASNYKLDQSLKDAFNAMTFDSEKIGQRNLDSLYDLLYDAQYLFDNGRKAEAQERLDTFSSLANKLFAVYGDKLKTQYIERVRREYEYLSFANPGDSLFGLRQVLENIYLDSIKGTAQELPMKFVFLTEKLSTLGYFAENDDFKNIKVTFDDYMVSFKDLSDNYQKEIFSNNTFIQRQNQALDNLFVQFASLYRQDYFTDKLFVENKYLTLLSANQDKPEEVQSIIAQRIDFLNRLEIFFLDGKVPLVDAQNILALLFAEINKIQLPADYRVAVTGLFNERLQDYGIFSRFLSSPEYVSSTVKGLTPKQRFERFKQDNPLIPTVIKLGQGDSGIITDQTGSPDKSQVLGQTSVKPKVPRVKNPVLFNFK